MAVRLALPFDVQCRAAKLPVPVPELRFAPPRRWRFDWAWMKEGVAMEVQGGLFVQGRHSRGAALLKEHEKLNAAAVAGWRVLFVTPKQIASGEALDVANQALRTITGAIVGR